MLKPVLWRISGTLVPPRFRLPCRHAILRLFGDLEDEIALIPFLAAAEKIAIDVGANFGLYSYVLAPYFSRVEAFEPNPEPLELLRAYGRTSIGIHPVGLSSADRNARLVVPLSRDGKMFSGLGRIGEDSPPDSRVLEVELRSLDGFRFDNVGLIKIDAEGHESEIIAGAGDTLRRSAPILMVEIEQRHLQRPISHTFSQIRSLGYRGFFLFQGALVEIEHFSLEIHQLAFLEGKPNRKYVNNFLFFPVDSADRLRERVARFSS